MTVQHEIVNKIADRIVADSTAVAGKPIVTVTGKTTTVTPSTVAGIGRISRAFDEAKKLGVASAVLAELRRRGHDAGASVRTEAAE